MGRIVLICGAGHSDRSVRIDALWREHWDDARLLTPTRRLARLRQEIFARKHALPGIWGTRAWELSAFAALLLEEAGMPVRMVTRLERRLIVRRILEEMRTGDPPLRHAISPGLVRHLLQLITQLKQAGIDPAAFRGALSGGSGGTDVDALVMPVYERYQEALLRSGRYDVPGLYWEAENCCHRESIALPGGAHTLLLDGFDDFTPSQQRFLVGISRHLTHLVIGINYDVDPDRGDLFRLQQQWVQSFNEGNDADIITCHTHAPKTTIHLAAEKIFRRNPVTVPEALESGLTLLPCADAQHEIETIGRRVKHLIVREGVAPSSIAVALTDMGECAFMLQKVFDDFGVPTKLQHYPSLLSTSLAAVVLRLFDLFHAWESDTLAAIVTSPWLDELTGNRSEVMAVPLIIRKIGMLMGREAWVKGVDNLRQRLNAGGGAELPAACSKEAMDLFERRVNLLGGLEDALPNSATLGAFARLCDSHLTELGISGKMTAPNNERGAVAALRGLLQAFTFMDMADTKLSLQEFSGLLREGMQETAVFEERPPGPGVFCCGIEGLRCENFSHVFLGGLNEGLLPRPAPQNALYPEVDLNRLRQRGMVLAGRSEHTYRERMLFYHALCAAQKGMTLSWRKQDKTGRESLPSPFVVDLTDLFGPGGGVMQPDPGPDCIVPAYSEIASPRDLANAVYYRRPSDRIVAAFPEILMPVRTLVDVEAQRNQPGPLSIYDGVIESPDLKEWLSTTYGPEAQFSVGQLERYIEFPFNFFLERVLRIRETEKHEGELEPLLRGAMLHEILQRFHEQYPGTSVEHLFAEDEFAVRENMDKTIESVFKRHSHHLRGIPRPVVRVEQRRFAVALQRYLSLEVERCGAFKPAYFEATFGRAPREGQERLFRAKPFVMEIDGASCRFSGKIDRIDLDGDNARLIDYKTASAPAKKDIVTGLSLQLTLYSWVVQEYLLPEYTPCDAYYVPLFKGKPREALLHNKAEDCEAREAAARKRVRDAITGIRAGYFPPLPDEAVNAGRRSYPSVARYERWRMRLKFPGRSIPDIGERSSE